MSLITFFDMLGIDPGDPGAIHLAAQLWPNDIVSQTPGFNVGDDSIPMVTFLQGQVSTPTLQFSNVRPGVDGSVVVGNAPGQLTLAADMAVVSDAVTLQQHTFYFRQLPDVGLTLYPTQPGTPARCFFARDSRGWELIVEALPAIITLKAGVIQPQNLSDETDGDATGFNENELDTLASIRNRDQGTQFYTNVRVHIRPSGDVILEPNIPLDQGPCHFLGFPVTALYDFLLIPAPQNREYYEWARNDLDATSFGPVNGAIGFRSVIFDFSQPPFSDMVKSLQSGSVNTGNIELVCEDVVFPLSFLGVPLPSHGTLGFRRKIVDRSNLYNAFSLSAAPVVIQLSPRPNPSTDPSNGATVQSGTQMSLTIDQILIQSGDPPVVEFQAAMIWKTATGTTIGWSIGIADDWTLQVGGVLGDLSPAKFTVVDTTVSVHALKFGFSFGRFMRGIDWEQDWQVLADLSVQGKPTTMFGGTFKLRTLTGKPLSLIVRDIGRSFGHFALDGLTFPDGVQMIICDTFRLIIEDMGWVEESSGVSYFSFSGGLGFGFGTGAATTPSGAPTYGTPDEADKNRNKYENGFAIEVRRLRFRTEDSSTEPSWKVDGISLFLKYNKVLVAGFGFITDVQQNGWQINEFGFGVQIQVQVLGTDWNIAAEFFKGHRTLLADPSQAFDYFLAGLTVGYLPAGSVGFYSVRVLLANNMTPAVDPPSTDGQGMVLYKWHKDHDSAIDMPRDRNLNDWNAVDNSLACGLGCGFSFNGAGKAMHFSLFILLSQSEALRGILAVGEFFLLKNPNPIAFVAIEYDTNTEKFGLLAGISLKLSDLALKGKVPAWMDNLVTLTGNLYVGNQKWMVALGQLADQRTWPTLAFKYQRTVLVSLDIDWVLAFCIEYAEGGSRGIGIVTSVNAGAKWGIGQVCIFGSLGILFGYWQTGSDSLAIEFWVQAGMKIYLFYILHIGLDVTLRISAVAKDPWQTSLSLTLRIDTPWWMPDVSFTYTKNWGFPEPYSVAIATRPLASAAALGTPAKQETSLLVPPLSDGNPDPSSLYSFNSLAGVAGVPLGDVHLRNDIPIVATDATIVINFTNPVSNDMAVASDTYGPAGDAGLQTVQDLKVRYGLKNISVRRSPRFGSGAGSWTDLVTPSDTTLDLSNTVHLAPALAFRWDVDSRADESLSPNRLLINSSTPYTFTTNGLQNDEEALRNDPGYPCCDTGATIKKFFPRPHVLGFESAQAGTRLQGRQQFSDNGTWWCWNVSPKPLAVTGSASTMVALLHPAAGVLASADFSDPAVQVSCSLTWTAAATTVYFEGYAGLTLIARQLLNLAAAGNSSVSLTAPQDQGITRLLLRADAVTSGGPYSLQLQSVSYVTASEEALYKGRVARCGSMSSTGGKLSFLPNYDYEITTTTEVKLSTTSQGERSQTLSEVTYFRTKGLPGLNSVANTGDEVEPYIESLYPPAKAALLYREEPVVVAFNDGMSTILPVDRVSAPTDPPEKTQAMELALNLDRVGSTGGLARLTVPSVDWIDAHRATPPPPRTFPRTIVDGVNVKAGVRKAVSADPLIARYVAVQSASSTCTVDPLRASQVLLHEPVDANNQANPWEAFTTLRATVRQKDGPYTQRNSFDLMDSGAFLSQADGSAAHAGAWSVTAAKTLVAPAASTGRQYASFGELTWNHVQVRATIDPHGSAAGIAVGVAGATPVPQAILATVEGPALILRALTNGQETELGRAAIATTAPVTLIVYAFDDNVRAQVGDTIVEAARGPIREGRVAVVANGPAELSALSVDGLDLYRFDFGTSRYQSFSEHIRSWNGQLPALQEGAGGGTSASVQDLLTSDAGTIGTLMNVSADPQARQALFTKWTTALTLPLRQQPDALSISRWADTTGTQALLIEGPEAISFVREVTVSLVEHLPPTPWKPIGTPQLQAALEHLHFSAAQVTTTLQFAIFAPGDLIMHVAQTSTGATLAVYTAPARTVNAVTPGHLTETIPPTQILPPTLTRVRAFPDGAIVLVRGKAIAAAVAHGSTTVPIDQEINLTVFDNGTETTALLLPVLGSNQLTPLNPGKYTLSFTIARKRWRDPASTDPEATYTQQQSVELSW